MNYDFFNVENKGDILLVGFKNSKKFNAFNWQFFEELPCLVSEIEKDKEIKVCIFHVGDGKNFSSGLDIEEFFKKFYKIILEKNETEFYKIVKQMQYGINKIAKSSKVFISAVKGYCVGAGLDFIAACDLRFCSKDALFSLRETKLGILADLGSLQRLPFIVGFDNTKYMALTGGDFNADYALRVNLVNELFDNPDELLDKTVEIGRVIANNQINILSECKNTINEFAEEKILEFMDKSAKFNTKYADFTKIAENFKKSLG